MNEPPTVVRIGNAQAFWGDRGDAALELVERVPDLDYLTLDYLAEVSLSILAQQRQRDDRAGFARDFLQVIRSLAPYWARGGRCRLITNAGGLDPLECARASAEILDECGCPPRAIGVVTGDDVADWLRADPAQRDFCHLEDGRPLAAVVDRLATANAYLGAGPIVEALRRGADIVITGRTADPSLILAPCIERFGWDPRDWNRLAGGTVAGHLVECGTQVTGGISTDWLELPDVEHLGFPIVAVAEDGSCIVTKPPGTGGQVNEWTVKEQLLYEVGDPARYLSPDVTVSFLTLQVIDLGGDRVRVTGATGSAPPEKLKVSATYHDGFRAAGTLTIVGRDAVRKAQRCGDIVLSRLRDAGCQWRDAVVECLGSGACLPAAAAGIARESLMETVLRIGIEAESRETVVRFTRELMPLITAGPQGTTGYAEGRPRVHTLFRYWPCLISRSHVQPHVAMIHSGSNASTETARSVVPPSAASSPTGNAAELAPQSPVPPVCSSPRRVRDIAIARSGDKGTGANVAIIARRPEHYSVLCDWLTVERVAEFFADRGIDVAVRYEVPNLHALNFVLHGILRQNLRTDAQGKVLGQALLEMELP